MCEHAPASAALGPGGPGSQEGERPQDTPKKFFSSSSGISRTSPHHVPVADADYVAALRRDQASFMHPAVIDECWKRFCRRCSVRGMLPRHWVGWWRSFAEDECRAVAIFKERRAKMVAVIERSKRATEAMLKRMLTRDEREAEQRAGLLGVGARDDLRRATREQRAEAKENVLRLPCWRQGRATAGHSVTDRGV